MDMKAEPGLYGFLPFYGRPRIVWPGGARLAFWCAPNIEHYEIDPPPNPQRQSWARPHPDVLGYSWRDYGNRVGLWRMMEVMDRHGVRGSVSLNVAVADHYPEIIEACVRRGWELFSHGVYNTRYTYGMTEAQERQFIEDVRLSIKRCSGQDLKGWLAPAITLTDRTIGLLAEAGLTYTLDLFHDDQPMPVRTANGRLVSVPYSLEINDFTMLFQGATSPADYTDAIIAQFDRLYMEGDESGRVMCLPLHPFLIGQPHRVRELDRALAYITGHAGVWRATAAEIAEHFTAHYYDTFVTAIAEHETESGA
ncbi:MAG: polysaccharide deacetylase family protein [Hyphomicrobiaceae bacterium]|nr:polysaccharide deacetylase family protein [Hyphomicrobiaceae bacterium]